MTLFGYYQLLPITIWGWTYKSYCLISTKKKNNDRNCEWGYWYCCLEGTQSAMLINRERGSNTYGTNCKGVNTCNIKKFCYQSCVTSNKDHKKCHKNILSRHVKPITSLAAVDSSRPLETLMRSTDPHSLAITILVPIFTPPISFSILW